MKTVAQLKMSLGLDCLNVYEGLW